MRMLVLSAAAVALLVAPARSAEDPKATIEKAIKAHGGADALNKYPVHKFTLKGTVVAQGMEIGLVGEAIAAYPDKSSLKGTLSIGGMDISLMQTANGDKMTVNINGMNIDLPEADRENGKFSTYASSLTQLTPLLKADVFTLKAAGDADVEGKPAVGVTVEHKTFKPVTLYFDKATNLLVRLNKKGRDEGNEVDEARTFSDYKAVDGVQMPHKETLTKDGKKAHDLVMEKYEMLTKIPAGAFGDE